MDKSMAEKNNWKTSNGDKVKKQTNKNWTRLHSLVLECDIDITWTHVPGHSGIAGNEEADSLTVKRANGNSRI